jgi:hypothetical protein
MDEDHVAPGHESSYPICGARTRSGQRCRRPAGWGTGHVGYGRCRLHCGATPTGEKAGQRQAAEARALELVAAEGLVPVSDPVAVLTGLAAEAVALVGTFRRMVAELDDVRYSTRAGGEQLRAEVALYERALDRAERFSRDLAKLGLEERSVRVSEAQAELLVRLIEDVLTSAELALTHDQILGGRRLLAEGARRLAGVA